MAEAKKTKREVHASPVGNTPRMRGGNARTYNYSNSNAILKGLGKFEPALQKLTDKMHYRQETTKAEADYKAGKPMKQSASDRYMTVYGKLKGAQKAIDFHNELGMWLEANPQAEYGEYETTKAKMLEGHAEGLGGYSLDAFLPQSILSVGKSDAKFQEMQIDRLRSNTAEAITGITRDGWARLQESTAPQDLPQAQRDELSDLQAANKGGALTRSQVTASYLRGRIPIAESLGRPELLDFADLKDRNGVALMDTEFADEIIQARKNAKAAALDNDKLRKDHTKELGIQRYNESNLRMTDAAEKGDLQAIREEKKLIETFIRRDANSDGILWSMEQYKSAQDTADKLLGRGANPKYSNQEITRALNSKGQTLERVDVNAVADGLNDADYRYFMNRVNRNEKIGATAEGKQFMVLYKRKRKDGRDMVSPKNRLGTFFHVNGAERRMRFDTKFDELITTRQEKGQADLLKESELDEIVEETNAWINKTFPAVHQAGTLIIEQDAGGQLTQEQKDQAKIATQMDAIKRKREHEAMQAEADKNVTP